VNLIICVNKSELVQKVNSEKGTKSVVFRRNFLETNKFSTFLRDFGGMSDFCGSIKIKRAFFVFAIKFLGIFEASFFSEQEGRAIKKEFRRVRI